MQIKFKKAVFVTLLVVAGFTSLNAGAAEKSLVLKTDLLKKYVDQFNADDEELYAHIPNKDAFAFLEKNIPLFECPDNEFERTYYFRWWTYCGRRCENAVILPG